MAGGPGVLPRKNVETYIAGYGFCCILGWKFKSNEKKNWQLEFSKLFSSLLEKKSFGWPAPAELCHFLPYLPSISNKSTAHGCNIHQHQSTHPHVQHKYAYFFQWVVLKTVRDRPRAIKYRPRYWLHIFSSINHCVTIDRSYKTLWCLCIS